VLSVSGQFDCLIVFQVISFLLAAKAGWGAGARAPFARKEVGVKSTVSVYKIEHTV
jgi:hypothetical protein